MKYTVTKNGSEVASYDKLTFCINTITNELVQSGQRYNDFYKDKVFQIKDTDGKVVWSTKNLTK